MLSPDPFRLLAPIKKKGSSHVQLFATPWTVACQSPLAIEFSSKNTGVGCHSLLQGIFPTQGLNPHPLYRWIHYHLSHQGSPLYVICTVKYPKDHIHELIDRSLGSPAPQMVH